MSTSARPAYERWLQEWSDIQTHLPAMRELAHGSCMEIGVRGGVSTSALLTGLEEHGGHLWSFDIDAACGSVFAGHPDWTFNNFDSRADAAVIKAIIPDHLNLLFIDGDHSYEAVLSDLTNYGLRADCILLHDTDGPDWPGVRKAIETYVAQTGRPVRWHSGSYGMGEILR